MNSNKKTTFILMGLFVLLAVSYILYNKFTGDNTEGSNIVTNTENKVKAANFEVVSEKNKRVKLSEMQGKPVVVNFWASWCGPCKSEMPYFDAMYEKYGEDIEFMMVNMTDGAQETKEAASSFIQFQGYKFPVYYDVSMSAAKAYDVTGIPATYFIDKEGYIVSSAKGAINETTLEEGIKTIKEK